MTTQAVGQTSEIIPQPFTADSTSPDNVQQRQANGVQMRDFLTKDVAKRPEVRALRSNMGRGQGLNLGDDVFLTKGGFRTGGIDRHSSMRSGHLACDSFESQKAKVEARLRQYDQQEAAKQAQPLGSSNNVRVGKKLAKQSTIFATAPLWLPIRTAARTFTAINQRLVDAKKPDA